MEDTKYLWWAFVTLIGIVGWFMRGLITDTKKELESQGKEISKLKAEQAVLSSNQDRIEESIETEVRHIREIMETKLDSISKNIEKLVNNNK